MDGLLRVAKPGFDCRVDAQRGLWGFCPTRVIYASDCGLAGYCFDNFSCISTTATNQTIPNASHHSSPPLGVIIGGVLGGVSIVCLTILGIFLIRRKHAAPSPSPSTLPLEPMHSQRTSQRPYPEDQPPSTYEFDGGYHLYSQKAQGDERSVELYEAEAYRDPVELLGR